MNKMSTVTKRGWKWAYRKMRDRATLYVLRGDTGTFMCELTRKKIRISR